MTSYTDTGGGPSGSFSGAEPWRPPYVIVGLGNEIAGDDGVGIWVARTLEHLAREQVQLEVVALPWAGFSLLEVLAGRESAAVIDCLCSGRHPPGTVVRLSEGDFRGSVRLNSFHDIDFVTVLHLGRRLGWHMPERIAIWGIEAAETGIFQEELSPVVALAVDQVIREVLEFFEPAFASRARVALRVAAPEGCV